MGLGNILAANTVYRVLNIGATFILTVLLSRLMGAAGYGLFSLIIVSTTIYNLISGFGAEAGITYHGAAGTFNTTKLLSFVFIIVIGQLGFLFLIGLIYKFIYHQNWFGMYNLWPVIFIFLSISLTDKYNALFYGYHKYSLSNKIIAIGNLLCLLAFMILYFFSTTINFQNYLELYAVINLLQAIFIVVTFHKTTRLPVVVVKPLRNEWKIFFSYSLITALANFIQFLAYRVDYWILNYYKGEEALGVYSVAVKLVQFFWIIPVLFAGMLFPGTAAKRNEFNEEAMRSLLRVMNSFNLITGVVTFFMINWFIPFFFGNEYAESTAAFQWLLPGIFLFCNTSVLAAYFAGKNLLTVNLITSLTGFAVIVLLDFLLIPGFGTQGAAISSSIGYSIATGYSIWKYLEVSGASLSEMFIIKKSDWERIIAIGWTDLLR